MTRRPIALIATAGFTVVELMIVVVIVGILAAVAAPSFTDTIEKQRAKNAAADLHASLTRARSEAIKRNANITLSAKTSGTDGSVSWANGWEIRVSGTVIEDHGSVPNLTFSGPASITYRSSGRISGTSNASFSITGTKTTSARYICVDLSGRPAIQTSSCS